MTVRRLYDELTFSYESASTRRYRLGRVDNIRSSHPEALAWATAMEAAAATDDDRRNRFRKALSKQSKVMKENIFGEGLDIPLLGIREACRSVLDGKLPDVFEDPVYRESNLFKLSTSQVSWHLNILTLEHDVYV
jgi:choline O-acetyltransferase